jgi:dihydrofolate reductase
MQLTLTQFVTLDGVVQGPGGPDEDQDGGFALGGWVVPLFEEELGRTMDGIFAEVDAFLLGRRTYEIFEAAWPLVTDPDDPIAGKLNSLPKYVASRTLTEVTWEGAELLQGDLTTAVTELKAEPGRELQVHGSGGLAQSLMRHGLIDEYRLLTFPVVLGTGKRLFRDGAGPTAMDHEHHGTTATGVSIDVYRPTGEPAFGRIGPEYQD